MKTQHQFVENLIQSLISTIPDDQGTKSDPSTLRYCQRILESHINDVEYELKASHPFIQEAKSIIKSIAEVKNEILVEETTILTLSNEFERMQKELKRLKNLAASEQVGLFTKPARSNL